MATYYILEPLRVLLDNNEIKFEKQAKNLGIIFDETLSWNLHIYKAIGNVYGLLRYLMITKAFIPTNIRLLLCQKCILFLHYRMVVRYIQSVTNILPPYSPFGSV